MKQSKTKSNEGSKINEFRCNKCSKLLFMYGINEGVVVIKCKRCGAMSNLICNKTGNNL
jgi:phage FluMu protein Com